MDEVMTAADAGGGNRASQNRISVAKSVSSQSPNLLGFSCIRSCSVPQSFTNWYKEKRWDSEKMISSGGMSSSHSATVTALAVAIGLEGAGAPALAIAVVLACVVMYDASGVKLHAGRQAELLNQIVCEFPPEHPLSTVRPLRGYLRFLSSQVWLHRYKTSRDSQVITALTLLKKHRFSYQGHVSDALGLGGINITGPHLHKCVKRCFKF